MTTTKERSPDRSGGGALKKGIDYTAMNYLRWAAWGVVNIESMLTVQRRNYINHVREELKLHGMKLDCGGSSARSQKLVYKVSRPETVHVTHGVKKEWAHTSAGGDDAFTKACLAALKEIDPDAFKAELQHAAH